MKVRKWKQKLFLYSCINPISILPSSDWSKNLMVCSDDRFRVGVRVVPHVNYIMLQHEKEKEIQIQITHIYRCNYIHFRVWGFELCSSYFKIILGKELIIFACQFKTISYQVLSFVFNEFFFSYLSSSSVKTKWLPRWIVSQYLFVSSGFMGQSKCNEEEKSKNSSELQDISRNHNDKNIETNKL